MHPLTKDWNDMNYRKERAEWLKQNQPFTSKLTDKQIDTAFGIEPERKTLADKLMIVTGCYEKCAEIALAHFRTPEGKRELEADHEQGK